MRDAAGHLTEGAQALLLNNLLLRPPQVRHRRLQLLVTVSQRFLRLLEVGDVIVDAGHA